MTYRVEPTAQAEADNRALFVIRGDVAHILCVRGPGEPPVKPEDVQS